MESSRQVRDSFAFKRGFAAPVVKLERMDRDRCYEERQAQVMLHAISSHYKTIYRLAAFVL